MNEHWEFKQSRSKQMSNKNISKWYYDGLKNGAIGGKLVGAGGGGWQAESGATARTSLGLGSGDSPSFVTVSATGTGSLKVPSGSTAQQGSPSQGGIRYNTDDSKFEIGKDLKSSKKKVYLNHPHCSKFCVLGGGSCSPN